VNASHARGFTLVELLVALTLFALLATVLSGALRLVGRSWEGGEAKVAQLDEMRQAQALLRSQIASLFPQRMPKAADTPLLFSGTTDEMKYVATLPERVDQGGSQLFRLVLAKDGERNPLLLERMYVDPELTQVPEFDGPDIERTVLAEHIGQLRIEYLGRDKGAMDTEKPTWRDRWEDPQQLPILIRVLVQPERGPAWPPLVAAPRRAQEAGCRAYDAVIHRCVRL